MADAAVSHAWAGLYEMTPDHNPIIGPPSDVAGFYTSPDSADMAFSTRRRLVASSRT